MLWALRKRERLVLTKLLEDSRNTSWEGSCYSYPLWKVLYVSKGEKEKVNKKTSLNGRGWLEVKHLKKGRVRPLSPLSFWGICFIVGKMSSLNSNKNCFFISRACSSWWICWVAKSPSNIIARTIVKKVQTFWFPCVYKLLRWGRKI